MKVHNAERNAQISDQVASLSPAFFGRFRAAIILLFSGLQTLSENSDRPTKSSLNYQEFPYISNGTHLAANTEISCKVEGI